MGADTEQPLIVLRFEGPTFAGDGLPASALREIALFQEVFVQVADEIGQAGNPAWGGLPEGLAEAVEPRVRSLRACEVELGWPPALNEQGRRTEQDEAHTTLAAAGALILTALERGAEGDLHPDLSLSAADKLSGFGATLMPQDSITAHWGTRPPVRVDRRGRNALRRAACEAADATPRATVGDLIKLAESTFGQVPDEVWAKLPVLGPEDTDDYLRPRR